MDTIHGKFTKEHMTIANKHMMKFFNVIIYQTMQTETSMSYDYTVIRMAKIKNNGNIKYW